MLLFWPGVVARLQTQLSVNDIDEVVHGCFLTGQNRTKCANFQGSPLFQATYNVKTEKQTIQLTLCQLGVPFFFCQPPTSNWHKVSWIVCFSVFTLYVAWKRGLPQKYAHFVLFRLIKKRSFNLLCISDLFFRTLAVNSVSDFFFVHGWTCINKHTQTPDRTGEWEVQLFNTDGIHRQLCLLYFVVRGFYLSSNHFHFVCIISSMIFISWQHFPRFPKSETAGASSGWKPSYQQQSPAKSGQPTFYAVLFEFQVTLTGNLISVNTCVGVFSTMPHHSSSVLVIWHQIWLFEPLKTILMNIHEVGDKGNPHRKWGWNAGLHCSQQNGQALPVKTCKSHVYQHNCSLLHFLNSMNNSDNNKIPSHSFPFLGKKKEKKGQVNKDSAREDTTVQTK